MSAEQNKSILARWIDEGWNGHNVAVADDVYAEDFTQTDPSTPMPVSGIPAIKAYVSSYLDALPDIHFTTHDLVAEGDRVVWRFTSTGTHEGTLLGIPPTGRHVVVTGTATFRFANNKIAEAWVNIDALGLLQQLGVIPAAVG